MQGIDKLLICDKQVEFPAISDRLQILGGPGIWRMQHTIFHKTGRRFQSSGLHLR